MSNHQRCVDCQYYLHRDNFEKEGRIERLKTGGYCMKRQNSPVWKTENEGFDCKDYYNPIWEILQ